VVAEASALGGHAIAPGGRGPEDRDRLPALRRLGRRELWAKLDAAKVYTSARLGGIRFSTHLYNDSADVDAAIDALAAILRAKGP
jgi:selenocysteine lyase/cysteine desulfurase